VLVGGVLGAGTKAAAAQEAGGGLGGDETVLLGETGPRGMVGYEVHGGCMNVH
jgi:hypothetical protein